MAEVIEERPQEERDVESLKIAGPVVLFAQSTIRENYDRLSRWYDLVAEPSERQARQLGIELLDVREGEWVLEVGFGTGHALPPLVQAVGQAGHVFGIDLSPKMTDIARQRLLALGLSARADLVGGDAAKLPFPPAVFDAIFMSFVLELFDDDDIARVLSECSRVLRLGGRLCVVSLDKSGPRSRMLRLYEWAHTKAPRTLDCRPIFVRQVIEQSGFKIAAERRASWWGLSAAVVLARKSSPDMFER